MPKKKKAAASVLTQLSVPKAGDSFLAGGAGRREPCPELRSFDWKAIQEGANSVVSSLNAAAASSLSRQPSSDSDSVLSLKSVSRGQSQQPGGGANPEQQLWPKLQVADDRGRGSSRDSTPPRSSVAASQKGGKLSQLPRTASPGSVSSSASRSGKQSVVARSGGGIPRSESASRVGGSTTAKKQRAEPEKPTLVRQSTFIKEAPSPTLKRKLEESAAAAATVALESPYSPDTPLPPTTRRHDVNRSHSESPSRPQEVTSSRFSRTGTWKRENGGGGGGGGGGKHSTSPCHAEKRRSEEDSAVGSKGTWRKAKSGGGSSTGRSFADKLEDVWVRLEDCPVNNPRSSSSCSARSPTAANAPPIIDSPAPSKIPSSSSSSSSNLNLRHSCESLDEKPPPPDRQQPQQQRGQQRSGAVAARVSPFNYTPSPRKSNSDVTTATTATTTTSSSSTTPTRPSLIPTPVTNSRRAEGGREVVAAAAAVSAARTS
ncbi:adenomatous polyposis coli protein [Lates japonicus]|uniref:Adenomatous polyposis coli protein n=1 Tax=Lates japonicus TaxID=270547 RepID=A0AAD3MNF5_LATJO|nr:adenomatous polyposis coli protein [Lates japonicus]